METSINAFILLNRKEQGTIVWINSEHSTETLKSFLESHVETTEQPEVTAHVRTTNDCCWESYIQPGTFMSQEEEIPQISMQLLLYKIF